MSSTSKKRFRLKWLAVILLVIGIGAVGYFVLRPKNTTNQAATTKDTSSSQTTSQAAATSEQAATGTVIKVGDSKYGTMLFDSKDQAIYIWQLEDSSTAKCYGDCAKAWPPVLTDGAPVASSGVNSQLLGTTTRTDGTVQVTYNNHPLYYYAHEGPGEVECHNIKTHGGYWWVIQPSGVRAQ